jgi:hypothetical protein
MKITDTENIKNLFLKKKQKTEKPGDKTFDGISDKKIKNSSVSNPDTEPSSTVHKVSDVLLTPAIDREEVVSRVSKFLDVMEEYSVKLSRKGISLKELSPLISRMEAETENMRLISEFLPPGDGIKEILDEVLIRSSVEVIKFNRGDYL